MMEYTSRIISTILVASALLSELTCVALKYDQSKVYSYSYQTDVLLNDINSKKATRPQQDVGVLLSIDFDLSTVYKDGDSQIFKLSIQKAQASSTIQPNVKKNLQASLFLPVLFQLNRDLVEYVYFADKDSTFSRNVKKGIVALFQVQENAGHRREVDVSGNCEVSYNSNKPEEITRTKSDCKNLEIARQFSNTNKALGTSLYIKSSQLYKLRDSVIETVSGNQRVIAYLNIRATMNGAATSSQNLQYKSERGGSTLASSAAEAIQLVETETGSKFTMTLLPSEEEIQHCTKGCLSPKALAANLSEDLKTENIATVRSAKAFSQMLKAFRDSSRISVTEALTDPNSYYIIPQLIDIAAAAQTEPAREALLELLDFEDAEAVDHPQRFLFAAAYSSHPSESLIRDLLSVLKKPVPNDRLRESLLLSLSAIVHTFCQVRDQCNAPIVGEFRTVITSGLAECGADECILMYLRAFGNAGLGSTVGTILPYAESSNNSMISSTAISALRRINEKLITSQVKKTILRIFHQSKTNYDSSVRVAALEFILDNHPSQQVIRDVLLSCLDQTNAELSTYIIRLLFDAASTSSEISSLLTSVLQDFHINNYQIIAQKGKSSVITSYLAQMRDLNATYSLYFENTPSGVMKRSGMIVSLQGKTIKQPLLKFGIYADGLESLIGQAEGNNEEAEGNKEEAEDAASTIEPTAGMSFTFMDVLLTQVEFFRGLSGLMSAAWNAPSELTSALQGNLLLQDHSQRIHLSNGLILNTKVLGVLSLDLSGYISISLWNRNCEALIRNSGAFYLEGLLRVDSEELDVELVFTGEGQSSIDYTSNADFANMPLKLCMQMKRPDFEFIHKVEKYEELMKGRKYRSHRQTRSRVSGEEYLLNKANSDECRVMLKEDQ
ncbi:hypothetical protein BsWGS_05951 [Bradybaena similaris]